MLTRNYPVVSDGTIIFYLRPLFQEHTEGVKQGSDVYPTDFLQNLKVSNEFFLKKTSNDSSKLHDATVIYARKAGFNLYS